MKRRIFATLLAFCLVASLCVVGAAADGDVSTAAEFKTALENGGEVTLTGDITISEKMDIVVTRPVTLNLNGSTVTKAYSKENHYFIVIENGGSLTINDTSGGKLEATGSWGYGIQLQSGGTLIVNGGTLEANQEVIDVDDGSSNVKVEINGGVICNTQSDSAINIREGAVVNITGGEIIASGNEAIFINSYGVSPKLNISGGTLTSGQWTIYASQGADVTISGDAVLTTTGHTGSIFMDGSTYYPSTLKIEGGTIEGDYVAVDVEGYSQVTMTGGSITTERNSAMELSENATAEISGGTLTTTASSAAALEVTGDSATAAISGGTFTGGGTNKTALSGSTEQVTVTGGTFSSSVDSYIPTDSALTQNPETGKVETDPEVDPVAEINGVPYATLQDAVDAANGTEGTTTINLVRNATGSGIKVQSGNNLIFDLGGFTYTVNEGVGSAGTETNCFQLLKDSNITIRNGSIVPDGVADLAIVIQNYSNLTLEDVVLDGKPLRDTAGKEYTLSNNNGKININAGTVIYSNGGDGDMAMDVCWAKYYEDGARVTVNEGVVINGDVELGLWNQTAYADNQSVLTMNGGTITGEVTIMVTGSDYGSEEEAINAVKSNVTIKGGSYGGSVDAYIDNPNEAGAKVTANGQHSYYKTLEQAQQAASGNPDAVVTDLSFKPASGEHYTVTLNYNDGRSPLQSVLVAPGGEYELPILKRSGYEFHGWRSGNRVFDGGETVPVYNNMTFTALWSMIEIPDTYAISVNGTANGEVDVSLNNASAGSVITITATPDEGYRVGAVTVSGPDGRVDVERVDATTYTFVMPAGGVEIDVSFVEDAALSEPFTDVSEGHWFYEYVAYVYTHGLMEGTSATTFEPDAGMTRAMFWAVLARIDGQSVSGANWLETARAWAMAEGVSDGTAASELVTREQMVTMLYRFAGSPVAGGMALSEFADAGSVSSWASDAMSWALGEGVISGMGGGMLSPQGTATRAQAAAILMRFVEG